MNRINFESGDEKTFHILDQNTAQALLSRPINVFFRNDDVGSYDPTLNSLIDVFVTNRIPLTLGIIPRHLTPKSINYLKDLKDTPGSLIELHQHGYCHKNHGSQSDKYEFGANRPMTKQHQDLAKGWELLCKAFPERVFKAFSAPWNRVSEATILALESLHFKVLSRSHKLRESDAPYVSSGQPVEFNVSVDLYNWKKRRPATAEEVQIQIETVANRHSVLGILSHHANMNASSKTFLSELIEDFCRLSTVTFHTLEGLYLSSKDAS